MSESSSSSGLLHTPPSGVDFVHRLRSDPKSHHIVVGSTPALLHQSKDGHAPPVASLLQRSSSSQAAQAGQAVDDRNHFHRKLPSADVETLHDEYADGDAADGIPIETDDPAPTSEASGADSIAHNVPTSPSAMAPVAALQPRAPLPTTGRVPPRRPSGASKRTQSDFSSAQAMQSETLLEGQADRQRRSADTDQLPPQQPSLRLGSNGRADWQSFCVAYAAGMWDPTYTPQPPHGPSGKFSTDVVGPAPRSKLPDGAVSPRTRLAPLGAESPSLQQQSSSVASDHAFPDLPSPAAGPTRAIQSAPRPEHEHEDPFDVSRDPPRKLSEGLPPTSPMLPSMRTSNLPRNITEDKADEDLVVNSFVSQTLGLREDAASASVTELDSSDEEGVSFDPGNKSDSDPLATLRAMPQYASFIESFPQINQPTEMAVFYRRFGFLPAPMGPRELERRKALYSFNILHTGKDMNFDRITHLCKLMFNTKMVALSLLDADTSWYKSASGLDLSQSARVTGFCSHTILSNSDEPMVVLDSMKDWRFARSPHVVDAPNIRFYAGAPLRTSDGHNLGALCLIDDKPWDEFPPRSRLILKELAMVVMRELELWRDKVSLTWSVMRS